jgi:hypothetical protein
MALIFDVPDDVINNGFGPFNGEEIVRLAVKCWIETHTPLTYSARLSRRDIVGMMAEDAVGADNEATAILYDKIIHALDAIDKYLAHVIGPHTLVSLDRTRWLGVSLVVQINELTY